MPANPAAPPAPAVALDAVSHAYGAVQALARTSIVVAEGSFVALVGPSGCGKTTLLRLLGGLETVQTGTRAVAPGASFGFSFQEPRLLPWRSVLDNVALPLELAGVPRAERLARAAEAVERVRLGDAAGRHPHQLSGGMRMRAALARAIVARPSVLFLDEPFGALDEVTRHELDLELRGLWERERFTAVLVTHSMPEAAFLAERIVVFSPRPARVVADLATPPGARDERTWTDPALGACVRAASDALLAGIAGRNA